MDVLSEVADNFNAAFKLNQRINALRSDPASEHDFKQSSVDIPAYAIFELFEPVEDKKKAKSTKSTKKEIHEIVKPV